MPQQFYLTADSPPYTPSTWKGSWNKTSDAVTKRLDSTKTTGDSTKYIIQQVMSSEVSTDLIYRVALIRYVSGPMIAQVVSGTMQMVIGVVQSDAAAELYFAIHAYVTQGDSDLVRGTLIDNFAELQASNNAWPTDPRGRNLIASAAMNSVNIQDDDRIVIEAGYIARNAVGTEYAGTMYYGTDFYSNGCPDMMRDP